MRTRDSSKRHRARFEVVLPPNESDGFTRSQAKQLRLGHAAIRDGTYVRDVYGRATHTLTVTTTKFRGPIERASTSANTPESTKTFVR
ncbi:hypothetical protein MRX96_057646 [Rhipicephalus microplus]